MFTNPHSSGIEDQRSFLSVPFLWNWSFIVVKNIVPLSVSIVGGPPFKVPGFISSRDLPQIGSKIMIKLTGK